MLYLEWINDNPYLMWAVEKSKIAPTLQTLHQLELQLKENVEAGFLLLLSTSKSELGNQIFKKCLNSTLGKLLTKMPGWILNNPLISKITEHGDIDSVLDAWCNYQEKENLPFLVSSDWITESPSHTPKGMAFTLVPPNQPTDHFILKDLWNSLKTQYRLPSTWAINLPITDIKPNQPGWIYLIKAGDTNQYKIGWTVREPELRLAEIRTSSPRATFEGYWQGTFQLEGIMHTLFEKKRIVGSKEAGQEWFELNSEDINLVKRLLTN